MIYHVYTAYEPKDPETRRRNEIAQRTWVGQGWTEVPVRDEDLPRLWKEEGRQFAYIKDVFDFAARGRTSADVLVYTNADIHCRSVLCRALENILAQANACYSFRRDFGRLDGPLADDAYRTGRAYPGSDLCAFRVHWWQRWRHDMPDMILGLEAWDPCYRVLVQQTNPGRRVSLPDVIGHERHNSYWERSENRQRLRGQLYCRQTAANWLRRHGVNPGVHGL